MNPRLFKHGDDLAISLPAEVAERYHLADGIEIEVIPTEEGVLLCPIGVAPWFTVEWERALDAVLDRYRAALEQLGE